MPNIVFKWRQIINLPLAPTCLGPALAVWHREAVFRRTLPSPSLRQQDSDESRSSILRNVHARLQDTTVSHLWSFRYRDGRHIALL